MCEVRDERRVSNVWKRSVADEVRAAIFMYAVRSSGEMAGFCFDWLPFTLEAPFWELPGFVAGFAGCPGMVCAIALRAM